VTGDITEDTIWESGKDYLIKGEVIVEEGVVLRINNNVNIGIATKKSTHS
jgi:hypothetical protein